MPELPEVEQVRRTLAPHLLGRRVAAVSIYRPDFILAAPADRTPHALLEGDTITELRRLGKSLALLGSSGRVVGLHLGMTGQFLVRPGPASPAALSSTTHIHIAWHLTSPTTPPTTIAFRDPRRFGEVRPLPSLIHLDALWAPLGPDALTITPNELAPRLKPGKRAIKAALLDQHILAGVGNIYADEALFAARISPRKHAGRLTAADIARLCDHLRAILSRAISAGGSTLRDFVDADGTQGSYRQHHQVYGRANQPCPNCQTTLRSALIAQRTTVWCPRCQSTTHTPSPKSPAAVKRSRRVAGG
jgi:formamidopyrimidine-DNA glycosylase